MKLLWTEEEPEFKGEFVSLPKVRLYPKPVQKPHLPIVFGGERGPALKRVAEVGDGWFGVNVSVEDATKKVTQMRQMARAVGRDPQKLHFSVSPGLGVSVDLDMVKRYRNAGVDQVMLGAIPTDPSKIRADIERLAEKIVIPAEKI